MMGTPGCPPAVLRIAAITSRAGRLDIGGKPNRTATASVRIVSLRQVTGCAGCTVSVDKARQLSTVGDPDVAGNAGGTIVIALAMYIVYAARPRARMAVPTEDPH